MATGNYFLNINHFDNSSVIIAGDWNVVQDYRVDTVNYIGENNPKSKLEIHQMINSMDLVDVWRDKHPGVKRYTWRGPNKKNRVNLTIFLYHLT
jgi:exonuclease III